MGFSSLVVALRLSSCSSQALEHSFSSCGNYSVVEAKLLQGLWDLPGPVIVPTSPALTGGFVTTEPPEKPETVLF